MLNYSTSPPAAMAASQGNPYTPPAPGGGNPGTATDSVYIRDALSGVIGKGYTDLKSDDARAQYAYLRGKLGNEMAQKLMTHALLFNQRTDMLKKSPQEKIQSFYDIGSNDPQVHDIISRAGKVSYGPIEGVNTSPDLNNMQITGRKVMAKDNVKQGDLRSVQAAAATLPAR